MKLCLAATCSAYSSSRSMLSQVPYVLESYYYIRDFQIPLIKSADLFLLDSGAFTFMNTVKGKVDWDSYIEKYIKFINEYDVKYFFELDIDSIVGYEEVKLIRKRIESHTGKKSIPVWHKSRGICNLIGNYDVEYIIIDPSAASMIETIQKYGDYVVVKADNDVLNGIQDVTKYLNTNTLQFHVSCKETFKEFEAYSWDEDSTEDKVIKENDHSMDQLRYFCRTALREELLWEI